MGSTARLVTIKRSGVDGIPFPLSLSTCLFGRGTECDIRIQLPVVSKQHCKIEINKQEAILYNFSSTNPAQVNGSAIDEPVPLRHGDIITIIDRSFRYENESHQNRSKSPEFSAKLSERKSTRRSSRASFSADLDGKDQNFKAHSNITEENVSGRSRVHVKELKRDSLTSDGSKDSVAKEPLKAPSSENSRHSSRNARDPTTGDLKEKSRVTVVGCYGELNGFSTTQFLDNSKKNESPFKKLYQSIKEELCDIKSQRQNVVQYRRKSGSPTAYTKEKGSANCSQKETQILMSCKSRPKSNRISHIDDASSPAPEMSQAEESKNDAEPIETSQESLSSGISLSEETGKTPVQHSPQQRSSRKRKSEDLHVTDREESMNHDKNEDVSLKRRRVSFGGHLRPELFDENLPPNTPLKRGETPSKRRSLGTHTPAVLKKIIKEQPQSSGKEESSEVKAQNVCIDALVQSPRITSTRTDDQKGRSVKASAASSDGKSPHETDMPKKAGRKSGHLSSKRASISRSQHDILQMISSKRRSGASEANLIVAKSWADVVKLGAKQTQMKVVKPGPQRQMNKRQKRPNTLKKPSINVNNQFSTGHANSPCTIVIGKAQIEKVNLPARPYRMLNSFVFNQKMDYNEDLSGLTEMFKTPVKEKPQMSTCSVTLSNSDNLLGKKSKEISSGAESLSIPSLNLGENVYSSAQNAAEEPSDKCFASPTLRRKCIKEDEKIVKTPRNFHEMTHFEMKTLESTTEPLKTVSSTNKLRRSVELRKMQMQHIESKNENKGDITENFIGKNLRKTPLREKEKEREMNDSERSLETCKENVESNENSRKRTTTGRSRSGGKKYEPTGDLTGLKRTTPAREPTEYVSGTQMLLQKTNCAKESPNAVGTTTEMTCKSSQPELIHSSTSRKRQLKTPLQKVDVKEVPVLRKHSKISEEYTHIVGGDKSMEVFKESPKQKLDPTIYETEMKRWSRMPKKAQILEDLAGIKELFQTPEHLDEPVCEYKTKVPCRSPHTKAMHTPRRKNTLLNTLPKKMDVKKEKTMHTPKATESDNKGIKAFKESAKHTQDLVANTSGSKRRPRIPKAKAQSLEDLTGFQELFQAPGHTKDSITEQEDQSRPVDTSTTSKRCSKASPGKIDGEEDLSTPRKLTQSPDRAVHTPTVPSQKGKSIRASMQTPKQKLDLTENLTELKRPARTPKTKAQPLEDLAGFQELFQTPSHSKEKKSIRASEQAPKQKLDLTENLTELKRPARTPKTKAQPLEDLAGFQELFQTPSHAKENKDIRASVQTPKQKLDLTENLTKLKRSARTPKTKAQPLEDLAGFQELFQTPSHSKEKKSIRASVQTPKQKLDLTENLTELKRPARTPKTKAQPLEDLAGFQELFQTPGHAKEKKGIRASVQTPKQKSDLTENLTELKRPARTPKTKAQPVEDMAGFQELFQTPSHSKEKKSIRASEQTPKQKLDLTENLTELKRPARTPKTKAQPLEDLAGFQELFQTPSHSKEKKSIRASVQTPKQKLDLTENLTELKRPARTPKTKVQPLEDLAGFQELFQTPSHSKEKKGIRASVQTPKQKLDLTENLTELRRPARTPKTKAQPLEDLAGFQELFQTPGHAKEKKGIRASVQTPKQKSDLTENLTELKRPARTPKTKAQPLEDLAGFQELFQTPSHSKEKKGIRASVQTPKQKLDLTENLTELRRPARTPKTKAQPLEDLAGFQELFQTPGHAKEKKGIRASVQTPKQKSDLTENLTELKRPARTPKTKAQPLEDLAGFQELFQTPSHSKEKKGIRASVQTPKQKLDLTENLTELKRPARTPKTKAQPLEDLAGFQELFQTPSHSKEKKSIRASVQTPKQKLDLTENLTELKRPARTPKTKAQPLEDLAGFQELFQTPSHSKEKKGIRASVQTPKQKLDLTENLTELRRPARTPKTKAQPLEDLAGFQELFRTPSHAKEKKGIRASVQTPKQKSDLTENLTELKRPARTPKTKAQPLEDLAGFPELFQTPSHSKEKKGIRASVQTPKQKLDLTENLTELKRPARTPKTKAQSLEDLAGFQELFQTPSHAKEKKGIRASVQTPKQKSDLTENLTELKRPARTPKTKAQPLEDLAGFQELFQTPSHTKEKKSIRASEQTPKQKLDLTENLTELKRPARTPKTKTQPLEDLAGFQELFQTPSHSKNSVTTEETPRTSFTSPQPVPAYTPTTSNRRSKISLGKVDMKEQLPSQKKVTQLPGKAMHASLVPVQEKGIRASTETLKQKLDQTENLAGLDRCLRTPKTKAQPLEDLVGFQELFQTSGHGKDPMDSKKTTKMLCGSPQPAPVDTPTSKRCRKTSLGKVDVKEELSFVREVTQMSEQTIYALKVKVGGGDKSICCDKSAEQTLDPATNVSGSKRQRRATKTKTQLLEDLTGFQEPFQTPGDAKDPVTTDEMTKITCISPQPGPLRTPPTLNSRPRTSLGIVNMKEVLSGPRKQTQSPAKSLHTSVVLVQEEKGIRASAETPNQKLDPAEHLHGFKRQSRTLKKKTQPLEDLTGFQEFFKTSEHVKDPITLGETTKMSGRFVQPGPLNSPATSKRCPKISLERADRKEMSPLRKFVQTTGEAMHTSKVLEVDDKVFKDFVEQTLLPVATSNKRQPKKRKEEVPSSEDLAVFQELFQATGHAKDSVNIDETTKMPCIALQTESMGTPTRVVRQSTSLGKKNVKEHSVINLTQIAGKIAQTCEEPTDVKGYEVFKKSTKRKLNSAESGTGCKRLRRESKKSSQPLEDLTGFKELFQTPDHTEESISDERTTKIPPKSQPEPVDTPRRKKALPSTPRGKGDAKEEQVICTPKTIESDYKSIKSYKESAKQTLDIVANVSGSRRWPRIPKIKTHVLEDLTGFQELFQTPDHAKDQMTIDETTKIPCTSLQPGPLYTPTTSKRRSKTSLKKIDRKEELSSLRRQMQSQGRAMHTPSVPVQEHEGIRASTETPKQKLDLTKSLTGLRRQLRTPKARAQPLEDLSGFQELFQTPSHAKDLLIGEKPLQTLCRSQSTPVGTQTTSKRSPKTSIGEMDVKAEVSMARKQTLRGTMHTHKEALDDKDNEVFKEAAKQKVDRAENVTGSKRLQRAPKKKDQSLEDLGGLQEFLQTPGHAEESMSDEKATIQPYIPPQSESIRTQTNTQKGPRTRVRKVNAKEDSSAAQKPTRMSRATIHTSKVPKNDEKDIEPLKELEKKIVDLAAGISGSRRWTRAAKAKAQSLQDQTGSKELSQTLNHTEESVRDEKTTKMPCRSPQEPEDTSATSKRRPRTRFGNVDMREELSTQRKQTGTTEEIMNTHKELTDDSKSIKGFKESTKRKLDPEENVTGSKRLRGAHKEKTQLLKDQASSKELISKPPYTEESLRDKKTTKMPCKSLQPVLLDSPTSTERQLRTRLGNVNVREGVLAVRKPTRMSRATTHTSKVPEGDDKDIKAFKESSEQTLDPATRATSNSRYPRASKAKSQVQDLPTPKEINQTPGHTEEQINDVHSLKSTPQKTPDSIKPLKILRRVLRVPKEEAIDLMDTKDPAVSQSKSNISLAPKWKSRQDRSISRTRGCVTIPQDIIEKNLVHSKQRTTPRERYKCPDPLNIMKKRARVVINRIESVEEQNSNMKSIQKNHTVQDSSTPNKGMSLRSRNHNKGGVNQQRLEIPMSEEAKIKRPEKKAMKTSEETEQQQNPHDGAGKPTSKGKVSGNRICLRSGRQNKNSQPHTGEEETMEILVKNQKEKEVTKNSDTVNLRSRRAKIQPKGNTLERDPEHRITRGAKRCAENPKKGEDIKDTKKIRTRSHRNSEDT